MTDAPDLNDVSMVCEPTGVAALEAFNHAGVLGPADVHAAVCLRRLAGDDDPSVALAVALAVRAPRVGHVSVDLSRVREVVGADLDDEIDLDRLPWPDPGPWLQAVAASPLVALGDDPAVRPVRLIGSALYLDRYWRDELAVAAALIHRVHAGEFEIDAATLAASMDRLFAGVGDGDQYAAVESGVRRHFSVIAGGPGTGKTTTVARLLAAITEQSVLAARRLPFIALAAPTGKAAARLQEAVQAQVHSLDAAPAVKAHLAAIEGTTLHRLLGNRPGTARFRHHRSHRLPHDVIVVDEASMISLGLTARLAEAVRPDARLVLVGDPEQLVSVEAGAVLADIVGPAGRVAALAPAASAPPIARCVTVLHTNHRFSGALAALAAAVQTGDDDAVIALLSAGTGPIRWHPVELGDGSPGTNHPVRVAATEWASALVQAARAGDSAACLDQLRRHRVLCAHRRGPSGVATWNERIETWLLELWPDLLGEGHWYAGRPVMITSNDYSLRLFNGDTGATFRDESRLAAAFDAGGGRHRQVSPSRLADVETVYAMTVHKSQGSEFDQVTFVLPPTGSRLLTRELLYTGVTRAKAGLLIAGSEEAVRSAVRRPVERASGLTDRLWGA